MVSSLGGNFLLNIGPKADGTVPGYERSVLEGVGDWLAVNGEAVFDVGVNPFLQLDWGTATVAGNRLFLHVHQWPEDGRLAIPGLSNAVLAAHPLGDSKTLLKSVEEGEDKIILLGKLEEDPAYRSMNIEVERITLVPTS